MPIPFELPSARGYVTVTGRYKGVPITLLAIGMGEFHDARLSQRALSADELVLQVLLWSTLWSAKYEQWWRETFL